MRRQAVFLLGCTAAAALRMQRVAPAMRAPWQKFRAAPGALARGGAELGAPRPRAALVVGAFLAAGASTRVEEAPSDADAPVFARRRGRAAGPSRSLEQAPRALQGGRDPATLGEAWRWCRSYRFPEDVCEYAPACLGIRFLR